jgi:hypothetical protein
MRIWRHRATNRGQGCPRELAGYFGLQGQDPACAMDDRLSTRWTGGTHRIARYQVNDVAADDDVMGYQRWVESRY